MFEEEEEDQEEDVEDLSCVLKKCVANILINLLSIEEREKSAFVFKYACLLLLLFLCECHFYINLKANMSFDRSMPSSTGLANEWVAGGG